MGLLDPCLKSEKTSLYTQTQIVFMTFLPQNQSGFHSFSHYCCLRTIKFMQMHMKVKPFVLLTSFHVDNSDLHRVINKIFALQLYMQIFQIN